MPNEQHGAPSQQDAVRVNQSHLFTSVLRLEGNSHVLNADIHSFLFALETAYASCFLFTSESLELYYGASHELRENVRETIEEVLGGLRIAGRSSGQASASRRASAVRILQGLVWPHQQLIFNAAHLNSTGFWEFLGSLNPLEVIRSFLNDRHERRKDIEYREGFERRSLELDIILKENKVISERLKLLRNLGAKDQDLQVLRNQLLAVPFRRLAEAQDKEILIKPLEEPTHEIVT